MTIASATKPIITSLPDHTQLPESDGTFVFAERAGGKNFQEHPQSVLLTEKRAAEQMAVFHGDKAAAT